MIDDFDLGSWFKPNKAKLGEMLRDTIEHSDAIPAFEPGLLVISHANNLYDNILLTDYQSGCDIKCQHIKTIRRSTHGDPVIVVSVPEEAPDDKGRRILYVLHPETCGWMSFMEASLMSEEETDDKREV